MGVGESTAIQVNFNRPDGLYMPGEQVSGTVIFNNDHDRLKLHHSVIELIGELEYTTNETRSSTDSNGNSTTEHYTEYHRIPFLTLRTLLIQTKDGKDSTRLDAGVHSWPFAFSLPNDLPPSSTPNPTAYPHIKYYTHIVFDRPWYTNNLRRTFPLTVYARPIPSSAIGPQPVYGFGDQNRKQLRVDCQLMTSTFVPGQALTFQLNLYNPQQTTIKRITATFKQRRETMRRQTHHEVIIHTDLPNFHEFKEPFLQQTFALVVPYDSLTPNHNFAAQYLNYTYNFVLDYQLVLEVRPHGMFTKFEICMPITVTPRTMNVHDVVDESCPPPSYEVVVKN